MNNDKYEIHSIASIEYKDGIKYDTEFFSCHGNTHDKWWYQNHNESLCTQSLNPTRLKTSARTISCYIQIKDSDISSLKSEFPKYIAG